MSVMATADTYSRIVLWLKVALPLAALAILSTLFFVAETLDPEAAIPYAEVDVARILREQGATSPNFGGVTTDGVRVALSANSIRPEANASNEWKATNLTASFDLPSGTVVSVDSPEGIVDGVQNSAILRGGAVLTSTTGYRITTEELVASFDDASVVAEHGIFADGPAGTITAERMMLNRIDSKASNHHLVFQGDVRLIHQPGN